MKSSSVQLDDLGEYRQGSLLYWLLFGECTPVGDEPCVAVSKPCVRWAVQMSCQSHQWRNRQKVAAPLGMEREEARDCIQQQSGEEAISYAKSQATEPQHENFFRSWEEQGLAMTDVKGKGKSEENCLHIEWKELEGEQTQILLHPILVRGGCWCYHKALPVGIERRWVATMLGSFCWERNNCLCIKKLTVSWHPVMLQWDCCVLGMWMMELHPP